MRPWMVNIAVSILIVPLTILAIGQLSRPSSSRAPGSSLMRTPQERQAAVQERLPNCTRGFLKDNPSYTSEYAEAFCECALPIVIRGEDPLSRLSGMYTIQDAQRQCGGRTISTLARRTDLKAKFDKMLPRICEQALQGYEDRYNKEKADGFCGCLAKSAGSNAQEMASFAFANASFDNSAAMKLYARQCGADFPAPGDGWLVEQQGGGRPRAILRMPSHAGVFSATLECNANQVLSLSVSARPSRDAGFSYNGRDDDLTFGEAETFTLHLDSRLHAEGKQAVDFYRFLVDQFEEEMAARKSQPNNFSMYFPSPKGKLSYLVRMGDIPARIGSVVQPCLPKANPALAAAPTADQAKSALPDNWTYSGRTARYRFPEPGEGGENATRPINGVFLECKPTPVFTIFGSKIEEIDEALKAKTKSDERSTSFSVRAGSGAAYAINAPCGYDEGASACYIVPSLAQLQALAASQEISFEYEGKGLVRLPFGESKAIRQVLPHCHFKEPEKKPVPTNSPKGQVATPAPASVAPVAGGGVLSIGSTYTLTATMNHRTYPAGDGRKAGELRAGTRVTVVAAANGDWSEISVDGRRGTFVKNSALLANSGGGGAAGQKPPASPPTAQKTNGAAQPECIQASKVYAAAQSARDASAKKWKRTEAALPGAARKGNGPFCVFLSEQVPQLWKQREAVRACPSISSKPNRLREIDNQIIGQKQIFYGRDCQLLIGKRI